MIKMIKREELPQRIKVFDSNWNKGIMIGNTIIFTGRRKEVKKIKHIYKEPGINQGFYIKYKKEPGKIYIIYTRE